MRYRRKRGFATDKGNVSTGDVNEETETTLIRHVFAERVIPLPPGDTRNRSIAGSLQNMAFFLKNLKAEVYFVTSV